MLNDSQKAALQKLAKAPDFIPVITAYRLKEVGLVELPAKPEGAKGARGYTYATLTDAGRRKLAD